MIITRGFGVEAAGGAAIAPQEVDVSTAFATSQDFDSARATSIDLDSTFLVAFDANSRRIAE